MELECESEIIEAIANSPGFSIEKQMADVMIIKVYRLYGLELNSGEADTFVHLSTD